MNNWDQELTCVNPETPVDSGARNLNHRNNPTEPQPESLEEWRESQSDGSNGSSVLPDQNQDALDHRCSTDRSDAINSSSWEPEPSVIIPNQKGFTPPPSEKTKDISERLVVQTEVRDGSDEEPMTIIRPPVRDEPLIIPLKPSPIELARVNRWRKRQHDKMVATIRRHLEWQVQERGPVNIDDMLEDDRVTELTDRLDDIMEAVYYSRKVVLIEGEIFPKTSQSDTTESNEILLNVDEPTGHGLDDCNVTSPQETLQTETLTDIQ
jgi:hypothetical protein